MNERDRELNDQAEKYADVNFKGEGGVVWVEAFELKFAELIRADERTACAEHYLGIMRDAIALEREACAKVCDDLADVHGKANQWESHKTADSLAQAIRARGNT